MKKFLSMVCVLALALALCVPAFADATSGQATSGQVTVDDKAAAVTADPTNYELAADLCATLQPGTGNFVTYAASEAMYQALLAQGVSYSSTTEGTNKNIIFNALAAPSMGELQIGVNGPANNEVHVEANFASGAQSPLGTYMRMVIPASELDASIDYMWVCNGQYGDVETIVLEAGSELSDGTVLDVDSVQVAFYAPHFSTYRIAPASRLIAERDAANSAGSPILARTNADVNLTVVIAAAMALVLTAGSAVVLKKRGLSK